MFRFCVLNIGNTHTQCAVVRYKSDEYSFDSFVQYDTSAIPFGELPTDIFMVYASVVPQITAIMQKKFPQSIPCTAANVPFIDFSDAPPTLGMDRIANCAALVQKYQDGIIIDAGTAITLEVVKNKKFIGGAILPGIGILARAMHDYTGALPLIQCTNVPPIETLIPETLTAKAMEIGIQSATAAGTLQLLDNFRKLLPENSPVCVCGGARKSILAQKTKTELLDGGENFTLNGLSTIATYHLKKG